MVAKKVQHTPECVGSHVMGSSISGAGGGRARDVFSSLSAPLIVTAYLSKYSLC